MGSVLRVFGKKLNIDKFDIGWKIKPTAIHRKSDLNLRRKKNKISAINFTVSDASFTNLNGQIKDTIKFLKKHNEYLKRISKNKTVDDVAIDFAFNSRIDRVNVEVQNDYFPAELIKLAFG